MITVTQIQILLSNLEDNTNLKLVFTDDREIIIDNQDKIEKSSDETALLIRSKTGKIVLINLEKIIFVCESIPFL